MDEGTSEVSRHCLAAKSVEASISKLALSKNSKYIVIGTKLYTNNCHIFRSQVRDDGAHKQGYRSYPVHQKTKSLPLDPGTLDQINGNRAAKKNTRNPTFGSSAFAKLTASASSLFQSFNSDKQ